MTLILTYSSVDKIVQVSDRRLTRAGKLYDDEANKAILVTCRDARFLIGYTGIAQVRGKSTDFWIVEELRLMSASRQSLDTILTKLFEAAIRDVGRVNALTITVTGFVWSRADRTSFNRSLSNRQDTHKQCLHLDNRQNIYAYGAYSAISRPIRRRIKRLLDSQFFVENTREAIADEMVLIIREAAKHPSFGKYIGPNCMSVSLLAEQMGYIANYHPVHSEPVTFFPWMVANGLALGGGPEPIFRPADWKKKPL